MRQSLEITAAIRLAMAQGCMQSAATALDDLGTAEAKQHAKELRGAIKIARRWEIELRKLSQQQLSYEG